MRPQCAITCSTTLGIVVGQVSNYLGVVVYSAGIGFWRLAREEDRRFDVTVPGWQIRCTPLSIPARHLGEEKAGRFYCGDGFQCVHRNVFTSQFGSKPLRQRFQRPLGATIGRATPGGP